MQKANVRKRRVVVQPARLRSVFRVDHTSVGPGHGQVAQGEHQADDTRRVHAGGARAAVPWSFSSMSLRQEGTQGDRVVQTSLPVR